MATDFPKEGLRAIVASLSGQPSSRVIWDGESRPHLGPTATGQVGCIVLNVVARRPIGVDEERVTYPDATTKQTKLVGVRVVTVSARAENYGAEEGFDMLERVRALLGLDDNREAVRATGVAMQSTGEVRTIDGQAGNRKLSFATLDLFFNQITETDITDTSSPTYVESIGLTGDPEMVDASDPETLDPTP